MQQGIQKYGVPLSLYSDRHMIFRLPNEKLTVEQELAGETRPLSNFGKAMAELRIEHIKAVTPQAKGRVERLWVTLQDRLVEELRLLGASTIEEANAALPKLIEKHNRQFAVAPRKHESQPTCRLILQPTLITSLLSVSTVSLAPAIRSATTARSIRWLTPPNYA